MQTFIITTLFFAGFISLMAIGYIVAGKRIKGSCGGLNAAMLNEDGDEVCSFCGIEVASIENGDCGSKDSSKTT